ncbi:choline ABC transporter substrate-binding protein [Pseudomonas sp. K1(2024)]|uniref:Choline ABC transporter substrate-binding protein n=2 Tax=Pseudomonas TaxID=286 RepID=A0AAI8KEQ0_9PSED|nr:MULTISPECIES: choline ABC transporter substrate-binding protein [Pseudomonas]AIZ34591.1 glycine/betaine ABC transporter substrate-binding protein [Pseudomonas parafulva]AXO90352.1 choline ABC transporter substrate-binding protein [Pseudomonas parafulva]MDO7904405.1 choline ABC transporter substrate-binding protein [Pseudomonas sp. K13]
MNASPSLLLAALLAAPVLAQAAEPEQCQTVRFSDVGWTDITVTTATTSAVLEALGYKTHTTMISVPVTYKSLANGRDLDVFLGNWMPTMENDIKAYRDAGTVETVRANLENAKYTLAVPQYLYDKGLKDFSDIAKFKQELGGKIYGIEPGNDGNRTIQKMIDDNAFGLKDAGFKIVQSSEAGMLSQVDKDQRKNEAIVFLGWEPHPMNTRFKMQYLTGGDAYFGPDFGKATVYTNTRKGYTEQCSNVGQLLKNLVFDLKDESTMMGYVLDDKMKPDAAAKRFIKDNPGKLDAWLAGVTTVDGKPGLEAAKAKLTQ